MANTVATDLMRSLNPTGKQWWWQCWQLCDESKMKLDNIYESYIVKTKERHNNILEDFDFRIQQIQRLWTQAIQEGRYRKIPSLEKKYEYLMNTKYTLALYLTDDYMNKEAFNDMVDEDEEYAKYVLYIIRKS